MTIDYKVNGQAMTLSVETSRGCGHLAEMDGETPDGSASAALREEIRQDAQIVADTLGKSIWIYASYPGRPDWQVDGVEPRAAGQSSGLRIGWLDSAGMPSHIHRTCDRGETTVCGHVPMTAQRAGRWTLQPEVPRKDHGRSRYCQICFAGLDTKSLPWLAPQGQQVRS